MHSGAERASRGRGVTMAGMAHGSVAQGNRIDGKVGYYGILLVWGAVHGLGGPHWAPHADRAGAGKADPCFPSSPAKSRRPSAAA